MARSDLRSYPAAFNLIGGGLPLAIRRDLTQDPRPQRAKLFLELSAKAGIDEQIALRVLHQSSGHGKVPPVEEQSSPITEGGKSMVHPCHDTEDCDILRRCGDG